MALTDRKNAVGALVLLLCLGGLAVSTSAQAGPKPTQVSTSDIAGESSTRPTVPARPAPRETLSGSNSGDPESVRASAGSRVKCAKVKCIALTFDDGPGRYTDGILKVLKANRSKATFFMLGSQVKGRSATVRALVKSGMEIGNHSWDHPDLRRLSSAGVASQLRRTDKALKAVGAKPTLYRPPYGAMNASVRSALKGKPIILWGVDTLDWKTGNTAATVRAASKAPRGAIVLMHDIHPSTAKAVPTLVKRLKAAGYHLVTVSELLGKPAAGKVYTGPYGR